MNQIIRPMLFASKLVILCLQIQKTLSLSLIIIVRSKLIKATSSITCWVPSISYFSSWSPWTLIDFTPGRLKYPRAGLDLTWAGTQSHGKCGLPWSMHTSIHQLTRQENVSCRWIAQSNVLVDCFPSWYSSAPFFLPRMVCYFTVPTWTPDMMLF